MEKYLFQIRAWHLLFTDGVPFQMSDDGDGSGSEPASPADLNLHDVENSSVQPLAATSRAEHSVDASVHEEPITVHSYGRSQVINLE